MFETVVPVATAWTLRQARQDVVRQAVEQAKAGGAIDAETERALDLLQQAQQWLSPSVLAAGNTGEQPATTALALPSCDHPGDTSSEGGGGSGGNGNGNGDPCKRGHSGGSQVTYPTRALSVRETLGAAGMPIIAVFNSRYETDPLVLSTWVPTQQAVDNWEIRIEGWAFQGTGAHPLAVWDTTNKQTRQPVPSGLYFFDNAYNNSRGNGSTMHAVVVRRSEDGPLGYNWSHNYQSRLDRVDATHVLLKTYDPWIVFTKQAGTSKEIYTNPDSPQDRLTGQSDGTWQWERTGSDGSPVSGIVSFDAQGHLTGFRDRQGNTTKLEYDAQGRLKTLTDAAGRTTRLEYDGQHIARVIDAAGAAWTLAYQNGNLTQIVDPLGQRLSFEYDVKHRIVRRTDARGNPTRYAYDEKGGVTTIVDAVGNAIGYETALNTEPLLSKDPSQTPPVLGTTTVIYRTPDGRETSRYRYTFNDMGKVVQAEQSPDGGKTSTAWQYEWGTGDHAGELLAVVDPQGNKTGFKFQDESGLLTQVKLPGRSAVNLTYAHSAKFGWQTSSIDRGGDMPTRVHYDDQGRVRRVQQGDLQYWFDYAEVTGRPRGLVSAVIWNWDGKGEPQTAPDAKMLRYEYDAQGQMTALMDPLGRRLLFAYDPAGRLSELQDALGRKTVFERDALGRMVRRLDAAGGTTRFAYDPSGNLASVTDARGNVTAFSYDHKDRLIEQRDPLGRTIRFGYDNYGRTIWRQDARGARVEFAYDGVGRIAQMIFPTGETWRGTMDATGRVTQAANTASAWSFEYNSSGKASKAQVNQDGGTATLEYRYDGDGRLINVRTSRDTDVAFSYGPYGELRHVKSPLGEVDYTYAVKGQLRPMLTEIKSGQLVETRTYDTAGRLIGLAFKHPRWTADRVGQLRYTYDAADNVTAMQDAQGTSRFEYDGLNQLVGATYPDGKQVRYTYDAVGNRIRMVGSAGTVEYTYDAANQILTAGAIRYYHDQNGNLIGAWQGGRGRIYAWDYQGYLRAVAERPLGGLPYPLSLATGQEATPLARYDYDLQGRQTFRAQDATAVKSAVRTMPGGEIDELRAWTQGSRSDAVNPMADRVGTIIGAVDAQGQTRYAARYDAWGTPLQRGTDNPLPGFQGRPYDPATGLYDFRARFYDPALGRFLSPDTTRDPRFAASLNGYPFGLNNPLRYRDSSGRWFWEAATVAFLVGYNIGEYLFNTPSECWTLEDFLVYTSVGTITDVGGLIAEAAGGPLAGFGAAVAGEYLKALIIQGMWEGNSPSEIDWSGVTRRQSKQACQMR